MAGVRRDEIIRKRDRDEDGERKDRADRRELVRQVELFKQALVSVPTAELPKLLTGKYDGLLSGSAIQLLDNANLIFLRAHVLTYQWSVSTSNFMIDIDRLVAKKIQELNMEYGRRTGGAFETHLQRLRTNCDNQLRSIFTYRTGETDISEIVGEMIRAVRAEQFRRERQLVGLLGRGSFRESSRIAQLLGEDDTWEAMAFE